MKSENIPKYREIANSILEEALRNGGVFSRSQLELADQFQVNRLTIRHALNWLERKRKLLHVSGRTWQIPGAATFQTEKPLKIGFPLWARSWSEVDVMRTHSRLNVARSIHQELAANHCELDIQCVGLPTAPDLPKIRELLQQWQGVILEPMPGENILRENHPFAELSKYMVVIGVMQSRPHNTVCPDFYTGSQMAVDEMVRLGSRKILYVGRMEDIASHTFLRQAGVEAAVARHPEVELFHEEGGFYAESAFSSVKRFLLEGGECDGILSPTGYAVQGALRALADFQIRVPQDAQVISLGKPHLAAYMTPRPTVVSTEETTTGREAAQMMLSLIRNGGAPAPTMILPMELIKGETTRSGTIPHTPSSHNKTSSDTYTENHWQKIPS